MGRHLKTDRVVAGSVKEEINTFTKVLAVVAVLVLATAGYVGHVLWQDGHSQLDSRAATSLYTVPQCDKQSTANSKQSCINGSVEAVTYRLYRTGLNRDPDHEGFNYWINSMMSGSQTPGSLAASVVKSLNLTSSTTTTTVQISDEEFVQRAYERILGRQPDAGGKAYWINRLKTGSISRDGVIAFFAQTAGITKAQAITRLGSTTKTVTNTDNKKTYESFVTSMYKNALGRSPDKGGLDYWVNRLKGGGSYATVLYTFAMQDEAINRLSSSFATYMRQSPPEYTYNGGGTTTSGGSTGNDTSNNQQSSGSNPYACNPPYPQLFKNVKDNTSGRKDKCVSAVQYALKYGAGQKVTINGVVDGPTVEAIRNFQRFFKAPVTGIMTPAQVSVANMISRFAGNTDNGGTTGGQGGSGGNNDGGGGTTTGNDNAYSNAKLKLVIVGAGFSDSDKATFDEASSTIINRISSTEPYASFGDKIGYATVLTSDLLGCSGGAAGIERLVTCNGDKVTELLVNSNLTADIKVVVVNDKGYGGSSAIGGDMATTKLSSYSDVIIHELGHTFGLADEYVYNPGEQQIYQGLRVDPSQPYYQCSSAEPPANWQTAPGPWQAFKDVNVSNWFNGCSFPDYYRSANQDIMNANGPKEYSPTSIPIITKTIKGIMGE